MATVTLDFGNGQTFVTVPRFIRERCVCHDCVHDESLQPFVNGIEIYFTLLYYYQDINKNQTIIL
jgi:hypothetical protein